MPGISRGDALAAARAALGVGDAAPAEAYAVRRLDRAGGYYLVVAGERGRATAAAIVDDRSGEVTTTARLGGVAAHPPVDAERARALAGAGAAARAELVWRSCRASRSPLYPLWRVETPCGPVHVDQESRVWRASPWDREDARAYLRPGPAAGRRVRARPPAARESSSSSYATVRCLERAPPAAPGSHSVRRGNEGAVARSLIATLSLVGLGAREEALGDVPEVSKVPPPELREEEPAEALYVRVGRPVEHLEAAVG